MINPNVVKMHLDNALRHGVWILGDPVWSQELKSVILLVSFQLGICCVSIIYT